MDNEKYNERICRIIWNDALQHSIRPFFWGINFSSIKTINNGTEFRFQNHETAGKVRIRYSERTRLFNVDVIPDNNDRNSPVTIENVEIKMLVAVIDENLGFHELVEHGAAV